MLALKVRQRNKCGNKRLRPRRGPMKTTDMERLHPRIDRKLARVARSSPLPAWHEAWSELGPHSTDEERLRVCRAIREAGALSEDAGYFLVSWAAEKL